MLAICSTWLWKMRYEAFGSLVAIAYSLRLEMLHVTLEAVYLSPLFFKQSDHRHQVRVNN